MKDGFFIFLFPLTYARCKLDREVKSLTLTLTNKCSFNSSEILTRHSRVTGSKPQARN